MKQTKKIGAAMVALFCLSNNAFSVDLDAQAPPAAPTLRSEIARGDELAFNCNQNHIIDSAGKFRCASDVLHSNEQLNRATEPFKFGLYMGSLMLEMVSYHGASERGGLGALASYIRRYYGLAKDAAARSNLPMESYCEVSQLKKEFCYKAVEEARLL